MRSTGARGSGGYTTVTEAVTLRLHCGYTAVTLRLHNGDTAVTYLLGGGVGVREGCPLVRKEVAGPKLRLPLNNQALRSHLLQLGLAVGSGLG